MAAADAATLLAGCPPGPRSEGGPAGQFPRDVSVNDGQVLVANFGSGSLETVQVADLP